MRLELTDRQRQELIDLVQEAYGETNTEIHHAMDHQFREKLRERRAVLEQLLKGLGVEVRAKL